MRRPLIRLARVLLACAALAATGAHAAETMLSCTRDAEDRPNMGLRRWIVIVDAEAGQMQIAYAGKGRNPSPGRFNSAAASVRGGVEFCSRIVVPGAGVKEQGVCINRSDLRFKIDYESADGEDAYRMFGQCEKMTAQF